MREVFKKTKSNKNVQDASIGMKFKIAFSKIIIGFVITACIAFVNIAVYAFNAEVNVFASASGIIAIILLIAAVAFNIWLCLTVSKRLTDTVVAPVTELQEAVRKVKSGQFDVKIKYESGDELGILARDLKDACAQMDRIVGDAGYLLGEMAEGRFNASSRAEASYVGEFKVLIDSMNTLSEQMDGTLRQIKDSAEKVMLGSEQMAGSAQELAEGAGNQAGAVQELTATIESVAGISEDSAENAVKAATYAKEAAENAKKNREEIGQLTEAMNRITATSQEIENIIVEIEDIASQTNLLSLNASIEAARAGEAGRGFAVVADQIGKLATDSAQSAVTTKELINKALLEIEAGNKIVDNTLEAIETVLSNMETFAGMASGAAQASKEQADMLKQIEAGIEQISAVVQSNSATAEETSAVSQELSAQSIGLDEMVAHFVLR